MLPDLRLLIPATVATFFLAAGLGLFASLRVAQEPPYASARPDQLATGEDSPIARISASWPLPEPGRAAALRDLARVVKLDPPSGQVASDAAPADYPPARIPPQESAAGAGHAAAPAEQPSEPVAATQPETSPASLRVEEPPAPQAAAASPAVAGEPEPSRPNESPAPKPEATTEGQRLASRPESPERASEADEPPAQAAPAEVVEPRVTRPRVVVRKRGRVVRRSSDEPFSNVPRPGFESPSNFSVYGRHTRSY